MSRYLAWEHGYIQAKAREAAIFAPRGDIPKHHGVNEDVNDDDSVFDLIAEREVVKVHDFYEKMTIFIRKICSPKARWKGRMGMQMKFIFRLIVM